VDVCPLCGPASFRHPDDPPVRVGSRAGIRWGGPAGLLLQGDPAPGVGAAVRLFVLGRDGTIMADAATVPRAPESTVEVVLPAAGPPDTLRVAGVVCRDLAVQLVRTRIVAW
jgi:hypothetical protein